MNNNQEDKDKISLMQLYLNCDESTKSLEIKDIISLYSIVELSEVAKKLSDNQESTER